MRFDSLVVTMLALVGAGVVIVAVSYGLTFMDDVEVFAGDSSTVITTTSTKLNQVVPVILGIVLMGSLLAVGVKVGNR